MATRAADERETRPDHLVRAAQQRAAARARSAFKDAVLDLADEPTVARAVRYLAASRALQESLELLADIPGLQEPA